ncbi:hypothetical protein FEZ63_02980 [Microvirga brassicacearum]|uniref:Uncharacterized protein n=1 Tax=Microvirga brassicacearum TaxID=2580413 RepID=A0A5N3PH94_9HYPH|nr:hypothetical protein FEZ63_02980 [Microvirga brassicacearum]
MTERLSDFPWVIVRVGCSLCPHRLGQYRLARLAEKFGAGALLCDVIDRIAFDCPWRPPPGHRPPGKYNPKCKAEFIDLGSPHPPDLPPPMRRLLVIDGGKS